MQYMDLLAMGLWKTHSLQSALVLITHQSGKEDAIVLRGRIIAGGGKHTLFNLCNLQRQLSYSSSSVHLK